MSSSRIAPVFRPSTLTALAAMLLVLATGVAPLHAAGQNLNMNLGFGTNYDSNLMQYSSAQRDVFTAGTHPDRYSISSLSDVTMNPTVGLVWTLDQGKGRRHILRARFTGDFQSTNHTRDYHEISAGWREVFPHGRSLAFGYYSLPGYYLRQLIAEDYVPPVGGSNYKRCDFDLDIASVSWDQRIIKKRTSLGLEYQFEHRAYVPDFAERTSDTHQGMVTLQFSAKRPGTNVSLLGGYRDGKAKGVDGDEIGGVKDDADISYTGPVGGIQGRYEFSHEKRTRWSGDVSYLLGSRKYSSDLVADVNHNGRTDLTQTIEVGLRLSMRPHWSVRGWYLYEKTDASLGPYASPTSVVGSYNQSKFGASVDWSGVIWRNRSEAAAPSEP
jgi:hypothetical protein